MEGQSQGYGAPGAVGGPLTSANCKSSNPATSKFCGQCGSPIGTNNGNVAAPPAYNPSVVAQGPVNPSNYRQPLINNNPQFAAPIARDGPQPPANGIYLLIIYMFAIYTRLV